MPPPPIRGRHIDLTFFQKDDLVILIFEAEAEAGDGDGVEAEARNPSAGHQLRAGNPPPIVNLFS